MTSALVKLKEGVMHGFLPLSLTVIVFCWYSWHWKGEGGTCVEARFSLMFGLSPLLTVFTSKFSVLGLFTLKLKAK